MPEESGRSAAATWRLLTLVAAGALAVSLTGCADAAYKPAESTMTLLETRDESVRIMKSLAALVPEDLRSPDNLPEPGTVPTAPLSSVCGASGQGFLYPGGTGVRLVEGADPVPIIAKMEQSLRDQGWSESSSPTTNRPDRNAFRNEPGFLTTIESLTVEGSDIITIDVWGPCVEVPDDFDRYEYI